jgi:ubiquinone/menaquinone biosynthesis C-methylase UbiE
MEYDKINKATDMIEQFVALQDQKILEVGCGDGRMSKLLAHNSRKYIAIDPDEQSIDKAKSELPTVDYRIGSGEALEFGDESFPIILFTLSLHHLESNLALKEAHRVLTADGQLVILEPLPNGEVAKVFDLFDDESERISDAWNMIQNSDFEIERHETFFTVMSFSDLDELCNYPFGRTQLQSEERDLIIETLLQLQVPATGPGPIHLHDDSRILSLRKKSL